MNNTYKGQNIELLVKLNNGQEIVCWADAWAYGKIFLDSYGVAGSEFINYEFDEIEPVDSKNFETDEIIPAGSEIVDIIEVLSDYVDWEPIEDEVERVD